MNTGKVEKILLSVFAGQTVRTTIDVALHYAKEHGCDVEFEFNGVTITVNETTNPDDAHRWWFEIGEAKTKAYSATVTPTGIKWGRGGR